MSKRPRSPNAARRASFGRAERLRREKGDTRQQQPETARQRPAADRVERAPKQEGRPRPTRANSHERKATPLHRAQERVERSREAADRRHQARLKDQTRAEFNKEAERRRDTAQRVEHDRKQAALREKTRRVEDGRKKTAQRVAERRRVERRQAFARAAEDSRKAPFEARQKELQQRAAVEIEREQKQRVEDQKRDQGRQWRATGTRRGIERDSFRDNETAVLERHHGRIAAINNREDRELDKLAGRRKVLGGVAELIPGRRAANDRKVDEIKRGFEVERQTQHRNLEALKARQADAEQKARIAYFQELKNTKARHRDERAGLVREMADERPRAIEQCARAIDRAEQALEQQRERSLTEQTRENVRPSGDFGRAASDHAREPAAGGHGFGQEGREMVRPSQVFGRA